MSPFPIWTSNSKSIWNFEKWSTWKLWSTKSWRTFMLWKIKSNFGNSDLSPIQKIEFSWIGIWNSNCFVKLILFHSELALVTKRSFEAYKILNNFCFGTKLTSVQILEVIQKKQKQVDRACYSRDPMRITGSLSSTAAARAAPRARVQARSLPAIVARRRGRPRLAPFSPLSTSVGAAARFLCPEPKNPDELLSLIHRNQSFPSQIDQSIASATFLRTQCTPELTP